MFRFLRVSLHIQCIIYICLALLIIIPQVLYNYKEI